LTGARRTCPAASPVLWLRCGGRRADSGRVNSSRGNHDARSPFPPEMLGQAPATPNGWLYAVDPALAPHGPEGVVPPEAIKGVWKVGGRRTHRRVRAVSKTLSSPAT